MTDTDYPLLSPEIVAQREHTRHRAGVRDATLYRLNSLTTPDLVVHAEPATLWCADPVILIVCTELCSNDTAHGRGIVNIPGLPPLCPDCAVGFVTRELPHLGRIDAEVTL